jgi:hypothetical protein
MTARVMEAQARFKKPADLQFIVAKVTEVFQEMETVKRKDLKAPPHHLQTVMDGLNLFTWPLYGHESAMKDSMKEQFDQISFYGNKILMMKKDKDTAWYNAYKDLAYKMIKFINEREETILLWNGSEDGAKVQAFVTSGGSQA